MSVSSLRLLSVAALAAATFAVQAHTPYLQPNIVNASARTSTISIDASLTDEMFIPDIAFGDHPFSWTAPDGSVHEIPKNAIIQLPTRTVVEHKITDAQPGTYRVVAGPRVGAVSRSWELDGKTVRSRDPKEVMPAGATLKSHSQSIGTSEVYITIGGEPNAGALKPSGKGLEIVPAANTHPNVLLKGGTLNVTVQYNGKPLADNEISLVYSNRDMSGVTSRDAVKTDAKGQASIALAQPGMYLASVRYAEDETLSPTKPVVRYSHSLTFNVMEKKKEPRQAAAAH